MKHEEMVWKKKNKRTNKGKNLKFLRNKIKSNKLIIIEVPWSAGKKIKTFGKYENGMEKSLTL